MFIVSQQDVEITKVLHPKGNLVSFLQYKGHIFCLAQSFGDNRDRAVTFSRYLTEDMGKLCVLLEEPNNFSVWSEDDIDQYPLPIDEFPRYHLSNAGSMADLQPEAATSTMTDSQAIQPVIAPAQLNHKGTNGNHDDRNNGSQIPVASNPKSARSTPPSLPVEPDIEPAQPQIDRNLTTQKRKRAIVGLSLILLTGLGLAGLAYWLETATKLRIPSTIASPAPVSQAISDRTSSVTFDTSLPNPKILMIEGSTTMVELMLRLRSVYAERNPNMPTTYGLPDGHPMGSNLGLDALRDRSVDLATSSRPLTPKEAEAGIQVVAIAKDSIAIVVGVDNPFKGELTTEQLRRIYLGKITNWSELGGANMPIRVINRAKASGSRDVFQSIVLVGREFAPDSSKFITWPRDETTDVLRALGKDGIYYATISQLKEQELVRIVPIEGVSPTDMTTIQSGKYPLSRNIYLAFPKPTSPAVKEFIDLALSPEGQQVALKSGFAPIK